MEKVPKNINVRVKPEQYKIIKANADNAGLSVSAFMKKVGQGFVPQSTHDREAFKHLILLSADMARLGNLLNQANKGLDWRDKTGSQTIMQLYAEIEKTRILLTERIREL